MRRDVLLGYLCLVAIWGLTWSAIKVGIATVPPFVFAFERALLVSLILTALALALRTPFPRRLPQLAAAAFTGVFYTGLAWAVISWSVQYIPTGLVSVFGATAPVWTAALAHFLVRGDRMTALKVLALALGLGGTVVLVGVPEGGSGVEPLVATALLALLPITWGFVAIFQARYLRHEAPLPTVAVGTWAGAVVLAPFAFTQAALPQVWDGGTALAFAYLVVFGSCVGLCLQLWLSRALRPTTMAFVQVIIPAEALLVGAFALGEAISWRMLGGAVLVAAAVVVNAVAGDDGATLARRSHFIR